MEHGPPDGTERSATGDIAERCAPTGIALCSECHKLPDCFGRLFCPRRDLH